MYIFEQMAIGCENWFSYGYNFIVVSSELDKCAVCCLVIGNVQCSSDSDMTINFRLIVSNTE